MRNTIATDKHQALHGDCISYFAKTRVCSQPALGLPLHPPPHPPPPHIRC